MRRIYLIALLLLITVELLPQACCSAGSPLLGSLDVSNASEGELQVGLTY
jgi:hypothetical protein